MKSFSTFAVLGTSIVLLLACQLEAKKPGPKPDPEPEPDSGPHFVQFVEGDVITDCPIATSKGETIKPALSGFALDSGDSDKVTLGSGARIKVCCVTVHHKRGSVSGVTLFFGTLDPDGIPAGIHRTDVLPASASVNGDTGVWTIHIDADCVDVWKEKGPGKGIVAGQISIGDIVYTPVL